MQNIGFKKESFFEESQICIKPNQSLEADTGGNSIANVIWHWEDSLGW